MAAKTRRATAPARGSGPGFFQRHENVFVYVPNLIGYARIALALLGKA